MTRRPAFTLVELLISIALVLILILGINQVFSIASKGVGAGQAMSTVVRDNRAASANMFHDLQYAGADSPFMMIRSGVQAAFASREDELSDRDYATTPTAVQIRSIDLDGNNLEGEATVNGEDIPAATYNFRNHRVDLLSFFASGTQFRRQTGNDTEFVNRTTSQEALIHYGHLRIYDGAGTVGDLSSGTNSDGAYPHPGTRPVAGSPNPSNFYARDWVLGRSQIVLMEVPPAGQNFLVRSAAAAASALSPLSAGSQDNDTSSPWILQHHRYDLAATSYTRFADDMKTHVANFPADPWWTRMDYRFICNPYVTKPLTSQQMAMAAPYFIGACTQFMVEFAGDYLRQEGPPGTIARWYGQPRAAGDPENTDGDIDYIVTPQGRKIRWYGMPRNVDVSDDITVNNGKPYIKGTGADPSGATYVDVVPLRDVLTAAGFAVAPTFERFNNQTTALRPSANYAAATGGVRVGDLYYAAFGPNDPKPKMIRITLALDDANGRLSEPQTYEYVVQLP